MYASQTLEIILTCKKNHSKNFSEGKLDKFLEQFFLTRNTWKMGLREYLMREHRDFVSFL